MDAWVTTLEPGHLDRKQIELRVAKRLAKDWRIGWYVAPHGKRWRIGKMTLSDALVRFTIVGDDGQPLHFPNVENALDFFRKELSVIAVAMFQT